MSNTQAILLGDSIRKGYQETVQRELAGEFEVWGPEENCRETPYTLEHFDEWFVQRAAGAADRTVLHLNCGLHDVKYVSMSEEPLDHPRIPLEEYKRNVQTLLERAIQVLPRERVIWALMTPVIDERHRTNKSFVRRQADVENYNCVASAVCKQLGVRMNDLHALVRDNDPEALLTDDGVHYTDAGKELLGKQVAEVIREAAG